jgi:hypothetical protein
MRGPCARIHGHPLTTAWRSLLADLAAAWGLLLDALVLLGAHGAEDAKG